MDSTVVRRKNIVPARHRLDDDLPIPDAVVGRQVECSIVHRVVDLGLAILYL